MALLYAGPAEQALIWKKIFHDIDPNVDLRFWPNYGSARDVKVILVARDIPGDLSIFPNLCAIQTLWAGVDKLLADPRLPNHLPLARMTSSALAKQMAEFVLYHSLDYLRDGPALRKSQSESRWQVPPLKLAPQVKIGVMGLGEMGCQSIEYLKIVGFDLLGYSASAKNLDGVKTFSGAEGRKEFLSTSDLVVCLLPLTATTAGILNRDFFSQMREGAWLIHAGRGGHLIEEDLLVALDQNRPARAILDVFKEEPLPPSHPFWKHSQISISPHCAAVTPPGSGAELILKNYQNALTGRPLINLVDRQRQY